MSLADLGWGLDDIRKRLPAYALAVAYDRGLHRLTFATEKYRNTFGDLFREFADNMCDDAVDSITDRLQINGWSADDAGINSTADILWDANRGAARAGAIFRNAFREGDGFSMNTTDAQHFPRMVKQRPDTMAVRYSSDNPDTIELAVKVWKQGSGKAARYRANVYRHGEALERYASRGVGADGGMPLVGAFRPLAAGDPDLSALDLDHYQDELAGMPVYHYPNGELSEYGRSFTEKLVPLQDALNKAVTDMLVAMEYHAYPQRWATGVEVPRNPVTGAEESPFRSGESRIFRVGSKDARMGQFDPAQLDGFLNVQDSFRLEIARKGYLPPSTIQLRGSGSTPPTGISLLVMEGRAVKLAKDRQRDWGHQLREQMADALNRVSVGATAADLTLNWAPAETRDEAAFWELAALKMEAGVPMRTILLEAGYKSEDIDQWLKDAEAVSEAEKLAEDVLSAGRTTPVTLGQASALGALAPTS